MNTREIRGGRGQARKHNSDTLITNSPARTVLLHRTLDSIRVKLSVFLFRGGTFPREHQVSGPRYNTQGPWAAAPLAELGPSAVPPERCRPADEARSFAVEVSHPVFNKN